MVEALVAAAIVAAMTAAVFQVVAANARTAQMMAERRQAVLVAQSALDLVSVQGQSNAPRRGQSAGLIWTADVGRYGGNGARLTGPSLDRVSVTVTKPGSDRVLYRLQTLALRP